MNRIKTRVSRRVLLKSAVAGLGTGLPAWFVEEFTARWSGPYVTRGKIEASRPELLAEPLPSKKVELYVSNDHMRDFFDCIRSRRAPICEAEIGHRSVSVCHLGGIALRLGRKLNWDPEKESFIGDKEADGYLAREMRKPWTYDAI